MKGREFLGQCTGGETVQYIGTGRTVGKESGVWWGMGNIEFSRLGWIHFKTRHLGKWLKNVEGLV